MNYTFNGTINGLGENYAYEWGVKYYDSDSESDESIKVTGQNLVWKWGIEAQEAPIFYAINGNDTLSWQSHGYHKSGDSIVAEPSYIFSHPNFNALWEGYDILKSSKSFCNGGLNGDQLYPMTSYSGANPYGNNENGWWFGKNGGASDSVRIDGIAQAFEKPTVPYKLNKVVVNCAVLEVTGNVKMTCKVYKLDEIPAYDESASVTLSDEPGELIAKGEAIINSQTDDQTGGLVFFTLLGEDDGLQYEITPTIDCPILVVIDGYNEPEMANLTDFSAMISSDIHVDEGFGELAYLKYGEMDQEGNIDYVWKGLNNFFLGAPELKTGLTIFLSSENHFLTFKYDEENGQYNFPAEGGELVKQFGGITRNYIDFFTSIPFDDGYDWWMICDGSDELPDWLHINLADGEWNWDDDIPTGDVTASVTADPLPSDESYREAVVRFHIPGTYIDYKFTQGEASPVYLRGDVNGDGIVSIKDVTALIDYLLSDDASSIILSNADVDANGIVNIADVTCLIDYLLSGSWPDDPVSPPDEHEWVDLGLPSGTLWATCNVGADSPEEYGDYFAWGETEPKEFYYWNTYKWCNSSNITLSKYCTDSSFGNNGFVDDKTELDPEDDAAYVNWGENWCMPTLIQQDELRMQCTWTWTTLNDVNGWLVTGPNGNSMFLPAAGLRTHRSLDGLGSSGRYWSRTLNTNHPDWVYNLYFSSTNVYQSHHQRCDGFTVRAVRTSQEPVELFQLSETEVNLEVGESKTVDILNGSGSYTVDGGTDCVSSIFNGNQLILTGLAEGTAELTVTDVTTQANASIYISVTDSDTIQFDHEWVDLGLPSGTLWATCNVGADSPEEYGDYFSWGETEPKDFYDLSTYKWIDSSNMLMKYCTDSDYGTIDNKTELDPDDDAAYMNLGALWRMPSSEQFQELCDECTWTWTTKSGVNGQLVTGPNGSTLFFPAAGYWFGSSIGGLGSSGHYWSCDLYIGYQYDACYIFFDSGNYGLWYRSRDYGRTVRAVRASQEPVQFQLSETEVSLEVGESKTVDILNGSGNYSVEGGSGCVTTNFAGDQLTLTGAAAGSDNVIVTDAATNATATLAVTVTAVDSNQPVTETFTVNGVSFTMVTVEGGTFTMGATAEQGDDAQEDEFPTHQVSLSSYGIGQTEVTQALWNSVMGYYANQDTVAQLPVEVAWNTCQTFIRKLNELTGRTFRLPTEAEWEFAARGGNLSHGYKYAGSNDVNAVACYSCVRTFVATKLPNELGLYDMSGNVSEWCQDWYGAYDSETQTNPTGPASYDSEPNRIVRGGDCRDQAITCRVSSRSKFHVACGRTGLGFRLAMDVDTAPVFKLSETEVNLEVGESKTVDILNGSGSYTVDGGTDCVSSTFNGNQLILTGISEGTAELIVTDVTTQANASIFVSVTDSDTIQTMTFTVNGVSFTMVKVEGGTFMMGATEDQGWYGYNQNSLPVHEVTLSTYYIGMTEVTQELWMAVMGENPSYYHGNLQYPVEYVSWNSCQTFLANLSSITGRQFRLPTEAEWEFAARGGIKTQGYKYSGSNDLNLVGWYIDNAFNGTSVVGAKMSNELGLFDMSGNVYEWCYDWYGEYSSEAQFNPTGPAEGTRHVHRGGGCNDGDSFSIISCRDGWGISPQSGSSQIGLRLALQYE